MELTKGFDKKRFVPLSSMLYHFARQATFDYEVKISLAQMPSQIKGSKGVIADAKADC